MRLPPPPRAPPRPIAGSMSVIAGGFQKPCMSGWPSGSLGMGPAGAVGAPRPAPRPPLPPSCPGGACPATGATKATAVATIVPATRANPDTGFFIRASSIQDLPGFLLAESQTLALILHQPRRGARLLNHGHGNLPVFSERHGIADRGFVEQRTRSRAREPFRDVQLVAVVVTGLVQQSQGVEVGHVNDEAVAIPMSPRITVPEV